jgi:TIR domain/OmpA family
VAHDVFISYSSKDKPTADAVCATLEATGIRCWIAPRDIAPGADWGESIVTAIERARVMVLVFSAHANDSPQIKREVERAVHKGIAIIPLRIKDVMPARSLEYFLSTPHWLDAFSPPLERHLQYLAAVVRQIVEDGPSVPPPSASPPFYRRRPVIGVGATACALLFALVTWLVLRPVALPSLVGVGRTASDVPQSSPVIGGPVLFARDQVVLVRSADETIAEQARFLRDHPAVRVAIEAHCGGADEARERRWVLAQLRANRVRDSLEKLGIAADRMRTENDCQPVGAATPANDASAPRDGQVLVVRN